MKAGRLLPAVKTVFSQIALLNIAGNHRKSAAQIALRFLLQQGIIVIPRSTHIERMKENLAALDFDLEADEIREIEQLEIGKKIFLLTIKLFASI